MAAILPAKRRPDNLKYRPFRHRHGLRSPTRLHVDLQGHLLQRAEQAAAANEEPLQIIAGDSSDCASTEPHHGTIGQRGTHCQERIAHCRTSRVVPRHQGSDRPTRAGQGELQSVCGQGLVQDAEWCRGGDGYGPISASTVIPALSPAEDGVPIMEAVQGR